jgi:hypothetical protein
MWSPPPRPPCWMSPLPEPTYTTRRLNRIASGLR